MSDPSGDPTGGPRPPVPHGPREVQEPGGPGSARQGQGAHDPFGQGAFRVEGVKVVSLGTKSPLAFWAMAIAAIAVGGTLLVVGFTLLLGLLAAGAVIGGGVMLVRRLTGADRRDRERAVAMMRDAERAAQLERHGLDPSMEVRPPERGRPPGDPPGA